MPESVEVIDDDSIRIIRMNRPEKKNALTQPMYAAMTAAFSAGADISEFQESAKLAHRNSRL